MVEKDESRLEVVRDDQVAPLIQVGVSPQTLERVLKQLQEADKLFDHNVPDEWRDPAREGLHEYLVSTYYVRRFEITGEEAVERYIQMYDFVGLDTPHDRFKYDFYLKPGMKGVIQAVNHDDERPLKVLWEPCDEFPEEQETLHNGNNLTLLSKGRFGVKKRTTSRVELLSEAAPGRLVEQTKVSYKYRYYLPVDITGIVVSISAKKNPRCPVDVVFGNIDGYVSPIVGISLPCSYGALKLYRENSFDIRRLIREA